MSQQRIDLNNLPTGLDIEIKPAEHPDDRASRLRKEAADANHDRWRKTAFYGVGLVLTVIIAGFGLWAALGAGWSATQQQFGAGVVTLIIGSVLGFLAGKNTK